MSCWNYNHFHAVSLYEIFRDQLFEFGWICTHELLLLLPIDKNLCICGTTIQALWNYIQINVTVALETDLECGHGRNSTSSADLLKLIHINLQENNILCCCCFCIFFCQVMKNWPDHPAWTTPWKGQGPNAHEKDFLDHFIKEFIVGTYRSLWNPQCKYVWPGAHPTQPSTWQPAGKRSDQAT